MTVKQLKDWMATVPEEASVEYERYGSTWDTIEPKKIRAMYVSQPKLTMDDVCNAEQVSS